MSANGISTAMELVQRVKDRTGIEDVDYMKQKSIPRGGYTFYVKGKALGNRTTLRGINEQVESFLYGYNLSEKMNY